MNIYGGGMHGYGGSLFRLIGKGDKLGAYEQVLFRVPFTKGGPEKIERSSTGFPEYARDKVKFKEEYKND